MGTRGWLGMLCAVAVVGCGDSDGSADELCVEAPSVQSLEVRQGEGGQVEFDFTKCAKALSQDETFVMVDESAAGMSVLVEPVMGMDFDPRIVVATITPPATMDLATYPMQLQALEYEVGGGGGRSVVARIDVVVTGEDCWNTEDDDGDTEVDCADQDNCAPRPGCNGLEECGNFRDDDGDGMVDCADTDCSELTECYVGVCDGEVGASSTTDRGDVGDPCRTDIDCHSGRCCNDDTECGEAPCQCRRGDF